VLTKTLKGGNERKERVMKPKLGQAIQGVSKGRKSFRKKCNQNPGIAAGNVN
jgi:hypothetical protein